MDARVAKASARRIVEEKRDELVALSRHIHDNPETCFEETRAAARVGEMLDMNGLSVETGICGLPTALRARSGSGPVSVVVCAEYDALAGVGHACGHNLIAAAAVGAGIALSSVSDEAGLSVTVLGTPAEEGGGGKILMLERGAFDGVHAAMMVHPWPEDRLGTSCLAVDHFEVRYSGREAHASASPEQGRNAADALVVAQVGIGLLRQHLRSADQVHGIVTKGGDAVNVVPKEAIGHFMIRAAKSRRPSSAAPEDRALSRSRRAGDRYRARDPRALAHLLPVRRGRRSPRVMAAQRRGAGQALQRRR